MGHGWAQASISWTPRGWRKLSFSFLQWRKSFFFLRGSFRRVRDCSRRGQKPFCGLGYTRRPPGETHRRAREIATRTGGSRHRECAGPMGLGGTLAGVSPGPLGMASGQAIVRERGNGVSPNLAILLLRTVPAAARRHRWTWPSRHARAREPRSRLTNLLVWQRNTSIG